jgi:hypothetical protein
VLINVQVVAQLHRQHLVTHLIGRDRRTIFTTGQISIESESGVVEETRVDPTTSFQGQSLDTPWDMLHVAYFASYALWSYLTIPFLYTYPGFVSEEIATWEENGEQWRALNVTFPDSIAGHTRNQISYFGSDGLLRRHEYTVDVLGNAPGLNYACDYRATNGLVVPHKRRVFAYDSEKRKVAEPLLVAIDKARNEIFNVSNGDVYRWRQLWNELAAFYDLPVAEPLAMSTVSEMSEKGPLWDSIVARYGLHATPYEQIANWSFVDWMLNFGEETTLSTIKIRKAGFADCIDTRESFRRQLTKLRELRIIP